MIYVLETITGTLEILDETGRFVETVKLEGYPVDIVFSGRDAAVLLQEDWKTGKNTGAMLTMRLQLIGRNLFAVCINMTVNTTDNIIPDIPVRNRRFSIQKHRPGSLLPQNPVNNLYPSWTSSKSPEPSAQHRREV
jgi:hypothetical protein